MAMGSSNVRAVSRSARYVAERLEQRTLLTQVTGAAFDYRGASQAYTYTFDTWASPNQVKAALTLLNLSSATVLDRANISAQGLPGNKIKLSWDGLPNHSLDAGHYESIIESGADGATTVSATSVSHFSFYPGDANGDLKVNFNDLVILAANYNKTSGGTFETGDFNYDGSVNFADLSLLESALQQRPGAVADGGERADGGKRHHRFAFPDVDRSGGRPVHRLQRLA
jgi:hypothetical protein